MYYIISHHGNSKHNTDIYPPHNDNKEKKAVNKIFWWKFGATRAHIKC